jgi:hypothetical protein
VLCARMSAQTGSSHWEVIIVLKRMRREVVSNLEMTASSKACCLDDILVVYPASQRNVCLSINCFISIPVCPPLFHPCRALHGNETERDHLLLHPSVKHMRRKC